MAGDSSINASFLICRSKQHLFALPLTHVAETMRVLPLEILPSMPHFMLGISIIRGTAIPVVDVAKLLGGAADALSTRYVTLKLGERRVALAVESVVGVRSLPLLSLEDIPPLLRELDGNAVSAITTLDAELLLVLQGARLIPAQVWDAIDAKAAA